MTTTSTKFARSLRHNQTDAESLLWFELRNRLLNGHKFTRQTPVGPYIVDLVCRRKKLIIELDGGQHCESDSDTKRTKWLNNQGYSVIRFWNDEVYYKRQSVLETILAVLEGEIKNPSPALRFSPATLSPQGRGKPLRQYKGKI